MSDSFLERRKAALESQGRKDLAEGMGTLRPASFKEVPASIPLEDRIGRFAGHEVKDRRPLHEVITFVSDTLLHFGFRISFRARSIFDKDVGSLSLEACEDALRSASVQDIRTRPGYYTALLKRGEANKDFFYRDLVIDVFELGALLKKYFPRGVEVWAADRHMVERMSARELGEALGGASPESIRTRGSFYAALYHQLLSKNV